LERIVPHTRYPTPGTFYDARSRLGHIEDIARAALKTKEQGE
jgi:hypothetical protein